MYSVPYILYFYPIQDDFSTFLFLYFSEPRVRTHLKNVYATLTMAIMASATGAYVHLFTDLLRGGGILFSLLGAGLALGLFFTPDNGKNRSRVLTNASY